MNYPLNYKKEPMLLGKHVWLKGLICSGLAGLVITIFLLLPGCGSETSQSPPASQKKGELGTEKKSQSVEVTAGSRQGKTDLVLPGRATLPTGQAGPGGVTFEEIRAKAAEAEEAVRKAGDKRVVVPPFGEGGGATLGEVKAKAAAQKKPNPDSVVIPPFGEGGGSTVSLSELRAKAAEAEEELRKIGSKRVVVPPFGEGGGATLGEVEAKAQAQEKARIMMDIKKPSGASPSPKPNS